ncbi:histidine ammonia-lyase-like [Styela clava]|uniref:histidine ammonia-lyase-like n=1 Tax=Styela clava TaxID=7725 RepID=UPI001939F57B|nr:histidine ammonia-lyase-like [Styela clava]
MKVYTALYGKWFAIPCDGQERRVKWLISETTQRAKLYFPERQLHQESIITSADGLVIYGEEDYITQVLQDGQYLIIGEKGTEVTLPSLMPNIKKNSINSNEKDDKEIITLDGESLTTEVLYKLSTGKCNIQIGEVAIKKIQESRDVVEEMVREKRVVYGISTGFGAFARNVIDSDLLDQLQVNLIMSHSAGVGEHLPPSRVRMLLALRVNVLCKGFSGISMKNLNVLVNAYNKSCLPYVPEKGTLSASGDLAPLAHIALGLMGKGQMWSPESGWSTAEFVLKSHDIDPLELRSKEGLALINGTQFVSSLGSEAVERAKLIALQADVIAALTVEALKGTSKAFDKRIHDARPHKGQQDVAKRMRILLQYKGNESEITRSHTTCKRVQDSYTLRCCPQVHGIAHDTIEYVKNILNTELNSATDNPMIMTDQRETISGGNFHGEYPAKALDYLAIGIHEIGAISERRIERLCNDSLSELPAFLVKNGGLNSGFMIAHCTAAALVSENKCLCHPSSVDSLSTSAAQEDHVAMGGWAARKAIRVVEHVENVVAIEMLCACQAIDFHRPLHTTDVLEEVHKVVRKVIPHYDRDRIMSTDIEAAQTLLKDGVIWNTVLPYLQKENQTPT